MALLANYPLLDTFGGVRNLEYDGNNLANVLVPASGVPGHFELTGDGVKVTVNETDAETYGERRAEMSFKHQLDPTGERWYTWKFMVPSIWNFNSGMAIMQIHEASDSGDPAVAVQLVLLLENGQLVARVPTDVLTPGTSSYNLATYPFAFDRWYSMCLHANWTLDTKGFWEMFVDGIPMFKQYGIANAYDNVLGGYLKLGIYNYSGSSGWGTKSIYVKDVSIWSGNDGYQAVMGTVPVKQRRMQQL